MPNIDLLVDAMFRFEMMSFMDEYLGYQHIQMHLIDEEKITFIMEEETYYYTMIPFGLKNVRGTYQRLFKNMFDDQIGQNMEFYVDYMMIRTKWVKYRLSNLAEGFVIIRGY